MKDNDTVDISTFFNKPDTRMRKVKRFFYRFYDSVIDPKNWFYRVRRCVKWCTWGFNPKDLWNFDFTASKWILPRLMKYREIKHGVPGGMHEVILEKGFCLENNSAEQWEELEKAWDDILNRMIRSFQLVVDDDWGKDYFKWQEEVEDGLMLFAKYFLCIWD